MLTVNEMIKEINKRKNEVDISRKYDFNEKLLSRTLKIFKDFKNGHNLEKLQKHHKINESVEYKFISYKAEEESTNKILGDNKGTLNFEREFHTVEAFDKNKNEKIIIQEIKDGTIIYRRQKDEFANVINVNGKNIFLEAVYNIDNFQILNSDGDNISQIDINAEAEGDVKAGIIKDNRSDDYLKSKKSTNVIKLKLGEAKIDIRKRQTVAFSLIKKDYFSEQSKTDDKMSVITTANEISNVLRYEGLEEIELLIKNGYML